MQQIKRNSKFYFFQRLFQTIKELSYLWEVKTMKRHTQLKLEDRIKIQTYLEDQIPVITICKKLNVSKQTIYREIQRNSRITNSRTDLSTLCIHRKECPYSNPKCSNNCERYILEHCHKIVKFPFICNTCEKKQHCRYEHRYYYAKDAQKKAEKSLREPRSGIKISQDDFQQINDIISPLVKDKGQSLNHILSTHDEIHVSERTLRNWINNGYTKAKNIDLPRTVSFKPKKEYIHRITKPSSIILGRTYHDFKEYCKNNPNLLVSQFDTVEGMKSDNKRILTIHFPSLHFQFGILLESNTPDEVNNKLLDLQNKIGLDLWKKIFPIMLSDNGIEFNKLYELEIYRNEHIKASNVFYCNPYCSGQKGACERNHELIRYIEPKYHSFNHLNQEKVNLIFSNINSLYRKSLPGITPYQLAYSILGKDFLNFIGIQKIEPDDVNLTQSLTKKIKQN